MTKYLMFHKQKWDDIHDENGNVVSSRMTQYWLDGFSSLDDCKDWVKERAIGSRLGALTMVELFAVASDKLVVFSHYVSGDAVVCLITSNNRRDWCRVCTKEEADTFINKHSDVTAVFYVEAKHLELHEEFGKG